MSATFDTIVIGGGQAGLAAAWHLKRRGARFLVLDAGRETGDTWRHRWESLTLFTPARYNALPGSAFPGDPYSLPGKDEVADYLAGYARMHRLPVRHGARVISLVRDEGRFRVALAGGAALQASSVIVATGANQRPHVPAFAASIDPRIAQIHSSAYRKPDDLPRGKVLVVGAGNSGVQIAIDLAASGREVVLSGRDTGSMPRRLLGRDIYDWLWPTLLRVGTDSPLGRRLTAGRMFRGDPLVGMKPIDIARPGITRVGRTAGASRGWPMLEDHRVLHGVEAIAWCTGYRPDYDWIELPILGFDGYPRHRHGLSLDVPGLAFVGMRYQSTMRSSLLGGVGEDAGRVVGALRAEEATPTPMFTPPSFASWS